MATQATHKSTKTQQRGTDPYTVLVSPRVTEKAALLGEKNVYTFNVFLSANKNEIKKAIKALYNVIPEKVRIVRMTRQRTFVRGRRGQTPETKKAYVYLKKGDSINIV